MVKKLKSSVEIKISWSPRKGNFCQTLKKEEMNTLIETITREEERQVTEATEVRSNKKQRLISEYLVDQQEKVETEDQPQVTDDDQVEIRGLRDRMMEENMVRRGTRAMERSLKSKRKARDMFWRYTN